MAENNLIGETFGSIKERLSSPVTGTFVLAWIVTNWRLPVVLFYGASPFEHRISAIEALYSGSLWCNFRGLALIPFLSAAGYLLVVPFCRDLHQRYLQIFELASEVNRRRGVQLLDEASSYGRTYKQAFERLAKDNGLDFAELEGLQAMLNQYRNQPHINKSQIESLKKVVDPIVNRISDRALFFKETALTDPTFRLDQILENLRKSDVATESIRRGILNRIFSNGWKRYFRGLVGINES